MGAVNFPLNKETLVLRLHCLRDTVAGVGDGGLKGRWDIENGDLSAKTQASEHTWPINNGKIKNCFNLLSTSGYNKVLRTNPILEFKASRRESFFY